MKKLVKDSKKTCLIVVIVPGCFIYWKESLERMIPPKALCHRDEKVLEVLAEDLVLGDIVDIQG